MTSQETREARRLQPVAEMRAWIRRWRLLLACAPLLLFVVDGKLFTFAPLPRPGAPSPSSNVAGYVARPGAPVSIPEAPGVTHPIAGYIVDGAGKPIGDVRVTLRGPGPETTALASATSEAGGEFRLPAVAGGAKLLLDAPHVFPAEVIWVPKGPAPRILLARRAHAVVHVVADGAPIAGAEVQITDGSRPTLATAITDRDGRARFDDLVPGPYEVWARHDLAVSPLVRVADIGAGTKDVELALGPGGGVAGQVVADGALPAGATVQLVPANVDHPVRTATLDATGKFAVDGLPPGRWRVDADVPGFIDEGDRVVTTEASKRTDVTVRLERAGVVVGNVVDAEGAPVEHAQIVLRRQGTDPRAAIELAPAPSTARLRWVHPLAGKVRIMPGIEPAKFGASRPGWRPAECGKGHCGVDIGSIRGQIIHAAADGILAGVYTEIKGEAGRYVVIDHGDGLRSGYLHMHEVRPGLEVGQRVRAGDPLGTVGTTGFALDIPHLHFTITQDHGGRSWFIDPEPMLRHAVVLPTPRAFDRVDVDARTLIASPTGPAAGAGTSRVTALASDAGGKFRIESVTPGTYVAVAFAEHLAPGTSAPFTVRTGADTEKITIVLRPGAIVRGRVLGRDGPIPGATITATAGTGESTSKVATAYADASGEYVLRSLHGAVTLTASAPGYGELEKRLAIDDPSKALKEDFDLVLENAQLRGQVRAADGAAAAGVEVAIVQGPTRRTTTTDAEGQFTIDRVARGNYVIEVTSPDAPPTRAPIASDSYKELRLAPGGSIHVTVYDTHTGNPQANARISVSGPGATVTRTSDARGVVELRGLALGTWTLDARAPGFARATQSATLTAASSRVPHELRVDMVRGARVAGTVRDRFGRRVAGAKVSVGAITALTDPEGNFELSDLPAGTITLDAELGAARASQQVPLKPGDERLTLNLELAE